MEMSQRLRIGFVGRGTVDDKRIAEICRVLKPAGEAKIQFEMLYPFISERKFGSGSSHAFEKVTVIWGWSRRFGIPLWRARILRHDDWQGARLGYREIIREFYDNGIQIYGIESFQLRPRLVWFYGMKR